jgi:hypothetical protein
MPIRDIIIDEASSAILEPISLQMTSAVLRHLGLGAAFDNNIYVTNDYTKPSLTSGEDHSALISRDRCDVKMTVAWNPTETKWDINSFKYTQSYGVAASLDRELTPVFADQPAGIFVTEHQMPCSMALDFSLQFKNRESAFAVISVINNSALKDSVINTHTLAYSYPVGDDLFNALAVLYNLRAATVDLNFWEWLRVGSKGAIQYVQQRTGATIQLIVKRQDLRAIGVLEFNQTAPTVQEQDRGIDRFVVEFVYTIQFARPDVLRLQFPVVVANQPVSANLIRGFVGDSIEVIGAALQESSLSSYLCTLSEPPLILVRRPVYDDFIPPNPPILSAGFKPFFQAAVYLDATPTTTIDLLNLGRDLALEPTVVTIMKEQGNEIFGTTGLFNVAVYCNNLLVDPAQLTIDANLVVTMAMQDRLKRYHLVLSEASDFKELDGKWYPTLIAYRTFFPITIVRNLQFLVDQQIFFVDPTNIILLLVNTMIRQLTIDAQIKALIDAGHLTWYAYFYTATAEQFVDYLIETTSPVTGQAVYDIFVASCIAAGLIFESQLPTGTLLTAKGYPLLPSSLRAPYAFFNVPLRIMLAKVIIARPT